MPYSFVTMWLAVRGAGLTRENAAGKRVLVHGAAGGLGTLALQMLSGWGAKITAIARPATMAACLQAGAAKVLDASKQPFVSLDRTFDATLNFATWEDDLDLVHCLRDGALGHATTVHSLLGNFDRYGWMRGALKSFSEKKSHRAALPKGTRNYAWTLFRPDAAALSELATGSNSGISAFPLPCAKLAQAGEAFDHVRKGGQDERCSRRNGERASGFKIDMGELISHINLKGRRQKLPVPIKQSDCFRYASGAMGRKIDRGFKLLKSLVVPRGFEPLTSAVARAGSILTACISKTDGHSRRVIGVFRVSVRLHEIFETVSPHSRSALA